MRGMSLEETKYQPSFSPGFWHADEDSPLPQILRNLTASPSNIALSGTVSDAWFSRRLPAPQDLQLSIDVPAFEAQIAGEITDLRKDDAYREVTIESIVDAGVLALLTLHNEPSNGAIQIRSASLSFQVAEHSPRSHFIADTLYAMLGLAGPVRISIPDMNLDVGLHLNIEPAEISKLLQRRQTYFGLMVIEKAIGLEFEIPLHISGEEMNSIAFAYHAIVARQFVWRVNEIALPPPANEEMLAWFDNLQSTQPNGCVYKLMFGPSPATRTVLGQTVSLGKETVFIEDGVIENSDNVRRELAQKDGHIVPIRIRPRSRKGRYVFSNSPRLPDNPWDEKIEQFIKLEDVLNERLAARYNELAASTVADLTPEEIEVVTSRPELDEDAYLIRD